MTHDAFAITIYCCNFVCKYIYILFMTTSKGFELISANNVSDNFIQLIGKEWFLLTAGTDDCYNTMTAAWGSIGFLWNKPVAFAFVRPQRYTFPFMENHDYFTMSFFDESFREALNYCGKHSGRDVDKAAQTGITPFLTKNGVVAFEQARLIIECRKIYFDDINPDFFVDKTIDKLYNKDYHRMYIGEIVEVLKKKDFTP